MEIPEFEDESIDNEEALVAGEDIISDSDETYDERSENKSKRGLKRRKINKSKNETDDDNGIDDDDDNSGSDDDDEEEEDEDDDNEEEGKDNDDEDSNDQSDVNQIIQRSKRHRIGRKQLPWTLSEDAIIIQKQKEIGNCWAVIAQLLKGRTRIEVKRRFKSIAKARRKLWTPQDDAALLQLHKLYGSNWRLISSKMKSRTKNAVMLRYRDIKNIQNTKKVVDPPAEGSAKQIFFSEYDSTVTLEKIVLQQQSSSEHNQIHPSSPKIQNQKDATTLSPKEGHPLLISLDVSKAQNNEQQINIVRDASIEQQQRELLSNLAGSNVMQYHGTQSGTTHGYPSSFVGFQQQLPFGLLPMASQHQHMWMPIQQQPLWMPPAAIHGHFPFPLQQLLTPNPHPMFGSHINQPKYMNYSPI